MKACIFATGLSGIVAEYVLSTLASYLLGNTVLQWTLTLSFMLFAMGIGSRVSRYFQGPLLDIFIGIELLLSLLCAISAAAAYLLSAYIQNISLVIYFLSMLIGGLIGLEIPIATRLNNHFEELRVNISSVMEHDYYGALFGGLFFAFFALPKLGLTYTPIVLGSVNFLIASALFVQYRNLLVKKKVLTFAFILFPVLLSALAFSVKPIILFGEQQKYRDQVIFQKQTPYQRIVMTQWKENFWLYLNGNEQFSSYDEERYHEPLTHPAMALSVARKKALILGGGDGLAVRELLKYPELDQVTVVDLDPAMTNLGKTHPVFLRLNQNALNDERTQVVNMDAYIFLRESAELFDVIIVDLPDPKTVGLARLYTKQFYSVVRKHLVKDGVVVTQATSPFFAKEAFLSILKSMQAANLPSIAYHNHIPTMGEWGWVLGMNSSIESKQLHEKAKRLTFTHLSTRFLNQDAMLSMLHFGKGMMEDFDKIKINDELDLALYYYYLNGKWEFY